MKNGMLESSTTESTLAKAISPIEAARADSSLCPRGQLCRSIPHLRSPPRGTRFFLCHDYEAPGREHYAWETNVGAQRDGNVHIRDGVPEEAFVAMRNARDRALAMPKLILPSLQFNIRGGWLPEAEENGIRYITIPIGAI